jgi:hypothetical protein
MSECRSSGMTVIVSHDEVGLCLGLMEREVRSSSI